MGRPSGKQVGITLGYCDTQTGQRVYPPPTTDLLPEQVPPVPGIVKPEQPLDIDDMFASVTTFPPLGQVSTVPHGEKSIAFTVLLEISAQASTAADNVKVCLWHSQSSSEEWIATDLIIDDNHADSLSIGHETKRLRKWYSGVVHHNFDDQRPFNFTIKFQTPRSTSWKWVGDHTGISDGQVIRSRPFRDRPFQDFFQATDDALVINNARPDTPDTLLFSVTAPVTPAVGDVSGHSEYKLGLATRTLKYFALVRLWAPWLSPRQGSGRFELDKDAVLVSFLRSDGSHVVILAVSGVDDVTTLLRDDGTGNVTVITKNDSEQEQPARVLIAVASSFEVANAAVMYEARKVVTNYSSTAEETAAQIQALAQPVTPLWFENWYDGFTYCTWNGLGQKLTEEKLLNALDELHKSGIVIENLIIDDNWQSNSEGDSQFQRGWMEFEANKEGFPRGLRATILEIRKRYPSLRHIAVWHAIMGYWGGVSPDGPIAKNYATTRVKIDMSIIDGDLTVVAASDIKRMYSDFYAFLSSCGVDSVKTDVQFYLDQVVSAPTRRELIIAYQDAWTLAHLRYFSARTISCMSQSPSIIFHSQLPTNRPTIPLRNSDDFFPEVEASHPWHIFCNAHNSLLTQHLNVVPDWDMFQTHHPWAWFHAAARAVSGGPIYFTDAPGKHDRALIEAMTARTPESGRRIILRPHRTGRSMHQYVNYTDAALVRVGTYVGFSRTGTGILGVFNCLQDPVAELVHLRDFPGAEGDVEYVIRDFEGGISGPFKPEDVKSLIHLDLNVRGWAILSAHPVKSFKQKHRDTKIALLGLVGKMTGVAAVLGYDVYAEATGRIRLWVNLKAIGVLGIYVSSLDDKTIDGNVMVLIGGAPVPRETVRISKASRLVLEIDFESLWEEDQGKAVQRWTWGNEVSLEIFVS